MKKNCSKCGGEKIDSRGRCSHCRKVESKKYREKYPNRGSEWRATNPTYAKEKAIEWRINNLDLINSQPFKDNVRDRASAWYLANRDISRKSKTDYYQKNNAKFKLLAGVWKKENRDKVRVYEQNRRCKLSNGVLSVNLVERLYKSQKGKCVCCGLPLSNNYHLDHIIPLALGGTNTDDNIQLLRSRCNSQKSAKHPIEFMQSRGFLL